ncbi:MAG: PepSY domain-containing protein [Kordiimonadaceae bacterium]|nr:PepSY domain-containing protein [Kordiimonadaceae bacterium]
MTLHKILYWPHLLCGVLAAVLIIIMSVTGVLLTYERQIISWAENKYDRPVQTNEIPIQIDDILNMNRESINGAAIRSIKISNDIDAPLVVSSKENYYINRYSGNILGNGPVRLKAFFSELRSMHRWLSMEGENRAVARMFTGAANLMFLFIVLSGMYLWIPKTLNWRNIKNILFFRKTKSSRARDINWHNVMGIWSAIPLVVIISTASVFYYSWANNLVYTLAGENPPVRGSSNNIQSQTTVIQNVSFESMFQNATRQLDNWTTITMSYPKDTDKDVRFSIDTGNGGEPQKKADLYLSRDDGKITKWEPFQDYSAGRRARSLIRFLHTGEALGVFGQTIAGIVSFVAIIMVWTGLALAYRKYIRPSLKKRTA